MNIPFITPEDLRHMLDDGSEIALLDVREEGVYSRDGHILLASNLPLSHLEMRAPALLPRKSVRLVVCDTDEGETLAQRAATRLHDIGYTNVHILHGGTRAWTAAGFRLYTGVYVPSKAFGEYILHEDKPPEITAAELHAWQAERRDLVVLDSRPLDEYRRNSIPGAIDCPSAELVYRAHDLLRSKDTLVVVNCGGRTRSIIGAQALINAGLENRVYALKDGTQGWHLAGYTLDHGRSDEAPRSASA
jgi:rhodanese-related sulfurtransferase